MEAFILKEIKIVPKLYKKLVAQKIEYGRYKIENWYGYAQTIIKIPVRYFKTIGKSRGEQ